MIPFVFDMKTHNFVERIINNKICAPKGHLSLRSKVKLINFAPCLYRAYKIFHCSLTLYMYHKNILTWTKYFLYKENICIRNNKTIKRIAVGRLQFLLQQHNMCKKSIVVRLKVTNNYIDTWHPKYIYYLANMFLCKLCCRSVKWKFFVQYFGNIFIFGSWHNEF